jgi:hypothetical protein
LQATAIDPKRTVAGSVRVIACIEEQHVISDKAGQALDRILAHLRDKEQSTSTPAPRTTIPGT